MRTTGVRCAPRPVPRPKQPPDPPPQPLPRTKFMQKGVEHVSQESPAQVTLEVISHSLPTVPALPSKAKGTPTKKTPPPKPPRTPSLKQNSGQDASPQLRRPGQDSSSQPYRPGQNTSHLPRRPGLMNVLSRPSSPTTASHNLAALSQPASTASQARPALQGTSVGLGATPTRRAPRPHFLPLPLPPPPISSPPRPPAGATPPCVPLRPSPSQLAASRARVGAHEPRSIPPLTVGLRSASGAQSPVCSVEDFEDSCKEVFRNTQAAKELAARGKHMQAASHYQVALTALDRVLRAHVLTLTQHEPTRQRLFLLQQDVFNLRKEALHGFTDAQTAARTPRDLSSTRPTPGAPPSYDDVLNEDRCRLQDVPPRLSRQLTWRGAPKATSLRAPSVNHTSRPLPSPTQAPAAQRPAALVRSHTRSDSGTENMVEVRDTAAEPITTPSTIHAHPRKPSRVSATRPKSSYHPLNQPDPSMSLPPATESLPPPLLPVSLPPASVPSQHSAATLLQPQPTFSPVLDEAVLSQMKALQVHESDRCADTYSSSASHPQEIPSLSVAPRNLQEGKEGKERVAGIGDDGTQHGGAVEASRGALQGKEKGKTIPVCSVSSIDDPFLRLDPFPSVESRHGGGDAGFTEDGSLTLPKTQPTVPADSTHTQQSHTPPTPTHMRRAPSPAFSDDFNPEVSSGTEHKESHSLTVTRSLADNLGDSILEALDFAITPAPGHRRVSPQQSREKRAGRSQSEENLLDVSHNTLEAILHPQKDVFASRASIIEEFDPLMASQGPHEEVKGEVCAEKELETWQKEEEEEKQEEEKEGGTACTVLPKPAPRRTRQSSCVSGGVLAAPGEEEGGICDSHPDYCVERGAIAVGKGEDEEGVNDHYSSKNDHGTPYLSDGARGRTSYSSSEDSSSMYWWPPDYPVKTPSTPTSPLYPCICPEEEEGEEKEEAGVDVGRSAFYLPPSTHDERRRRDLLRIRDGVKIYFIHTDGVITSPWNKPFLSVSRDPAKAQLLGEGLLLSVGNNLWACELHKKATLVLRTQAGVYIFSEVAGRPECKAVGIRVPSSVRRIQQELLSKILQQNTLVEEERPKGITKAISKSASSAATRMNKLMEDQSKSPSQPFVRRNSIRALKGVTKRLNIIVEKTGAAMKELPEEYQVLQEAADTLAFARSSKMIQYI